MAIHDFKAWLKYRSGIQPLLWAVRHTLRQYRNIIHPRFAEAIAAIPPGAECIDIGANIGFYTYLMARTGATVHAYEPGRSAFETLRRNLRGQPKAILHRAAVGTTNGEARLYYHQSDDGTPRLSESASICEEKRNISRENYDIVKQLDIANVLAPQSRIHLVKIDIERAELQVLRRILDLGLNRRIPYIFCEMHDSQLPQSRDAFHQLREEVASSFSSSIFLDWK